MDIGKAFTYVFEDPNWIMKVLIGGILLIIPIVNFVVIGYALTTLKNVADGQPTPLPEWSDFGAHFMKGLYAFVGMLVYFLPAIIIYCCIIVLSAVVSGGASQAGGQTAGDTVSTVVGLVSTCLSCIVFLYALFASLTLAAPLTRFAMSANELALFWDFRGNLDFIRDNLTNYIIALLVGLVASFVSQLGIILCLIGVLFTTFWAYMVQAFLFGQLWQMRGQTGARAAA